MIMLCSSMMIGNHDNSHLRVLIAGNAGGQLKTGPTLNYREKPKRRMCSLFLSLMDKMGVRMDGFGDSNERLSEVWPGQPPPTSEEDSCPEPIDGRSFIKRESASPGRRRFL